MNKNTLKVQMEIGAETGELSIKTIGETLSNEDFMKLCEQIKEQISKIPGQNRVITLVNGQQKTCAGLIHYANTGMNHINFDDEHTVVEDFGVIMEVNIEENKVDQLYIDPKIMKEHYDQGAFEKVLYEEVGIIEGEEEENLRKIEKFIRALPKGVASQSQQMEHHMYVTTLLGAFSFYFGSMIIENVPNSEWALKHIDEITLIMDTIEGAKMAIDPLIIFNSIYYDDSNVSSALIWEKMIALAGTELSPLIIELMENGLEKKEALKVLEEQIVTAFKGCTTSAS